jgi:hypothetical protein
VETPSVSPGKTEIIPNFLSYPGFAITFSAGTDSSRFETEPEELATPVRRSNPQAIRMGLAMLASAWP